MKYIEKAIIEQKNYDFPIVLAKQGNKIFELNDTIISNEPITFLTIADKFGYDAYVKSVTFLMIKSFYKVIGKDNIDCLKIPFPLGDNLFVEAKGNFKLNENTIVEVKNKMRQIVEEDVLIKKNIISKTDAMELFKKYKMHDKEKLFKYRRVSNITLYSLGHFQDYFYGDMVYSTGVLKWFDLKLYKDGFVLILPNIKTPTTIDDMPQLDHLYDTMKAGIDWSETMGYSTVGDLNNAIVKKEIDDLILAQESDMERRIGDLAKEISKNNKIKFVMIAGPSSSGKTSFCHRLCIQLKTCGLKPHSISVDNYFINREDIKPDENGVYDFESIDIVDTKQFNEDMLNILSGKKVELPYYNFVTGSREYKGDYIQLQDNEILIIEGIHCLNDKMSYALPTENKYKIYISALSQIRLDEHNRVSSSDIRLLRRIARDARTRNMNAAGTIAMWGNVRKGELENIFPYQENADSMFNSSIIYELLVMKNIVEPLLFDIDESTEEYIEAKRLLKFLDFFLGYNDKTIPINSLSKEFIGGSYFDV